MYLLPDYVYDVLKWVGLIACPAFATFIGVVGPTWGLANSDAIVVTINATGLLVGSLIGVSQLKGGE